MSLLRLRVELVTEALLLPGIVIPKKSGEFSKVYNVTNDPSLVVVSNWMKQKKMYLGIFLAIHPD